MKIVFDFAGVVFHWQPQALLKRLLPQHASDDPSAAQLEVAIFQQWGGDWADFDRGTIEPEPLINKIAARTGLPTADVRAVVDAIPHELQPAQATLALMRDLMDAGHGLFFLSNMPAPYADHLEANNNFIQWFKAGVFSARVHAIKPEETIFRIAEMAFGAQSSELVFIDDVLRNVVAAQAAGWRALQFIDAAQCRQELQHLGAR